MAKPYDVGGRRW